jgi:hypothetical protein
MAETERGERIVPANTGVPLPGQEAEAGTGNPVAAARVRAGADWFFWIAGLSAVNSAATLLGWEWRFLAGLGVTQVVDYFASADGGSGPLVLAANVLPLGFFAALGALARRGSAWAFLMGLAALAIDGGLALFLEDWFGAAFHAYAFWRIYGGLRLVPHLETEPGAAPGSPPAAPAPRLPL